MTPAAAGTVAQEPRRLPRDAETRRRVHVSVAGLLALYVAATPMVSAINGFSLLQFGISAVGPLYHTAASTLVLLLILLHRRVSKEWATVVVTFASFALIVTTQIALGFSEWSDVGQLYKYCLPALLFAATCGWNLPRYAPGLKHLMRVFPITASSYSGLIGLSALLYFTLGIQTSVFNEGIRFTGFVFAYNGTVNAYLLCAYVSYVVMTSSLTAIAWRSAGMVLLRSKAALLYFVLAGFGVYRIVVRRAGRRHVLFLRAVVLPVLAASLVFFGYQQTLDAANVFFQKGEEGLTSEELMESFVTGRMLWWQFVAADLPGWPATNLAVGNGMGVVRQGTSDAWFESNLAERYKLREFEGASKALELDWLCQLDLFGLWGLAIFAWLFGYRALTMLVVWRDRIFYALMLVLAGLTGQVLNNPQVYGLVIVFLLVLRHVRAERSGLPSRPRVAAR